MPDPDGLADAKGQFGDRARLHKLLRWIHLGGMIAPLGRSPNDVLNVQLYRAMTFLLHGRRFGASRKGRTIVAQGVRVVWHVSAVRRMDSR
jgi:hypothetical protein